MSAPDVTFTVGLKHLAADGRKAGVEFGETERTGVNSRDLRQILRAAEALAPCVNYPLVPEIRISAPTGRSVVQLKDGRLNFISWSSATSRGGNPTADQIIAIISGEEIEDDIDLLPVDDLEPSIDPMVETARAEIDLRPTEEMARNATNALEVRRTKPPSERGMIAVGLARARDISNRVDLSPETVKRMVSFFARHEVDKDGATWSEQGKGWQAWNGWGGDAGYAWAKRKVEELEGN